MNKITKAISGGALVAALALPLGWAVVPASADPTPSTTTSRSGSGRSEEQRAARRAERQERLADELGVSVEDLQAARRRVLETELDQRVEDGRITQELADRILQAAEDGNLRELRRQLRAERAAR